MPVLERDDTALDRVVALRGGHTHMRTDAQGKNVLGGSGEEQ